MAGVALAALLAVPSQIFAATTALNPGFSRLLDAVARIDVRETTLSDGARRFEASIGSGVILSDDGLVLTNAHVVSPRAVEISVTLSNLERVGAKLVGWDHWTDLALLRLDMGEVSRRHLAFAHGEFGDSDQLYPGETVYAVGTPYGLTRTVTRGIISNTHRYFEDEHGVDGYETGAFNTWLQTDAAINPGNSGGPLVTEDGRIVGITSRAYLGANNLGFAIPSNTAQSVVRALVKDGSIVRSYIGIVPAALQDLESFYDLALDQGLLIDAVDPGSPAERAGLHVGDIVLAMNGRPLDGRFPEQLPPIQNAIASLPVGSKLSLTVKRANATREVTVVTERLESSMGEEGLLDHWGLSVRKLSRADARQRQLLDNTGVIVLGVQPGYPADVAGVQAGDVLTRVNRRPIASLDMIEDVEAAYSAHPGPILLEAQRDRETVLCILKP